MIVEMETPGYFDTSSWIFVVLFDMGLMKVVEINFAEQHFEQKCRMLSI